MFSGFAAAVLAGVCGAAEAATYTLASQDYVTKQLEGKQNVLTAGDGIAIDGDTISAVSGLEDESGNPVSVETALSEVVNSVTTVENKLGELPEGKTVAEALSEKQATLENAAVLEQITSDDVASIGTTASAVESLSGTVGTITNAEGAASTVAAEITALRSGIADADAAASDAASSGNDVPQAISVMEINASFTPHFVAITTASSTKKWQPVTSTPRPTTTFTIDFGNFSFGIGYSTALFFELRLSRKNDT
jgi:hypothetical protein